MISKKLNSCISEMAKSNGYSYSGQGIAHEPGHQYQNGKLWQWCSYGRYRESTWLYQSQLFNITLISSVRFEMLASSDIYEVEHIMNHRRGKSGVSTYKSISQFVQEPIFFCHTHMAAATGIFGQMARILERRQHVGANREFFRRKYGAFVSRGIVAARCQWEICARPAAGGMITLFRYWRYWDNFFRVRIDSFPDVNSGKRTAAAPCIGKGWCVTTEGNNSGNSALWFISSLLTSHIFSLSEIQTTKTPTTARCVIQWG